MSSPDKRSIIEDRILQSVDTIVHLKQWCIGFSRHAFATLPVASSLKIALEHPKVIWILEASLSPTTILPPASVRTAVLIVATDNGCTLVYHRNDSPYRLHGPPVDMAKTLLTDPPQHVSTSRYSWIRLRMYSDTPRADTTVSSSVEGPSDPDARWCSK
jgi:hypothetical protein